MANGGHNGGQLAAANKREGGRERERDRSRRAAEGADLVSDHRSNEQPIVASLQIAKVGDKVASSSRKHLRPPDKWLPWPATDSRKSHLFANLARSLRH